MSSTNDPRNPNAAQYYFEPNPNPNTDGYSQNPNSNSNGHSQNLNPYSVCFVITYSFFFAGIAALIIWDLITPGFPDFSVASFEVSNFNLSTNSLTSDFNISIIIQNTNKKVRTDYSGIRASLVYGKKDDVISETRLLPFSQRARDVTDLKLRLAVIGEFVDEGGIRWEDGDLRFGVRVSLAVKFKGGAWRRKKHHVNVHCDDIRVGLNKAMAGVGSMVGPPTGCQV